MEMQGLADDDLQAVVSYLRTQPAVNHPVPDHQYTVLGKVDDEGMFCVDRLERGEPPENPDKMVKVTVQ